MSQRYIGGLIYNPPGGFSGYFDGSGDYLTAGTTSSFNFLHNTTALFTIEAWIYCSSFSAAPVLFSTNSGSSAEIGTIVFINSSAQLRLLIGKGSAGNPVIDTSSSGTVPTNQWVHIAVTYDQSLGSNNAVFWVNGVSAGTASKTGNAPSSSNSTYPGTINGYGTTGGAACYLSNVRVNNSIVYSAAFTPPVGPLQAITNTSLLTCAYPTFRDGSSNNFTITVNGNTAVSTQNPFPQTQLPNPALGNQGNGVYSMSQYQALRSQNLWPAIDPYFDYVTLMLHGNGTNGAQNNTFLDSSTNNFTITRNGNTTQGTFTPFGSNWSNYFDGSGDYLTGPTNNAFNFGTGDFSIEAWIYLAALPAPNADGNRVGTICAYTGGAVTANQGFEFAINATGNTFYFASWGSANFIGCSFTPTIGTWVHLAATRSGGVGRLFVNGVSQTLTTNTLQTNTDADATIRIGTSRGDTGYNHDFPGYISNLRIVKGTAVYTSNFTPSTSPLTAITNTSLLTCQSNQFIDNSSNAFALTRNGDVSIQRFSPFNPTVPYAAGTIGGSGYFDGSGDYLTSAVGSGLSLSNTYTIEGWIYNPGNTGGIIFKGVYNTGNSGWTGLRFGVRVLSTTTLRCYFYGTTVFDEQVIDSTIPLNSWFHFAMVRNGTTGAVYINGAAAGTISGLNTPGASTQQLDIGVMNITSNLLTFGGYISGLRIVDGTAVYTSAFTPPTAPPTAITNTSLLLNFTNGGIIDNAMMNDLETVGNAQISTSVSKFGGGSLAFDGTGDYLLVPSNPNIQFGTGSFTIEGWVYSNSISTPQVVLARRAALNAQGITIVIDPSALAFAAGDSNTSAWEVTFTSSTLASNTWYHFAFVRDGSSWRAFVNGVQIGTTTTWAGAIADETSTMVIGANSNFANGLNGYIDDLRITKGYARYTANFTPQRSQWQDQ